MSEEERLKRNNKILSMYNSRMTCSAIAKEMGISTRQVQRVISGRVGVRLNRRSKSKEHILGDLRVYIVELMEVMGRNFERCEQCGGEIPYGKFQIHHTRYDGATLADLQIVCQACNLAHYNRFLA